MQWVPLTLQVLDWHTPGFAAEQPAWPLARPHLPFEPQAFVTHSFAAVQLVVVFGPPQVFAVPLHVPLTHTADAVATLQTPVCRPSFGIGCPFARSTVHAPVSRLQCWGALQSASTQQVPASMQVPEVAEQRADWHNVDAVAALQPPSPSALPHLRFVPHTFTTQPLAPAHATPFSPAQVFVVALQRPLRHAAFVSPAPHASCRPSAGSGSAFGFFGVQVKVLRAQNSVAAQSPSIQHLPEPAGTQALTLPSAFALHVPDWQLAALPKQGPDPFVRPHLPSTPQRFETHWLAFVHAVVTFGPAQVFDAALH
jgi:hypothetical protein